MSHEVNKDVERTNVATPIRAIDQTVEVFEIYSPKLKRTITIALKHNPDGEIPANLLSDGGLVMMPVPLEFGRQVNS